MSSTDFTATIVTDERTAVAAIREAGVLCDDYAQDGAKLSVNFEYGSYDDDYVTVFGLCAETYGETGTYASAIRVIHDDEIATFAWAKFRLDPTRNWCEQIRSIVDWLATESPVPA